MFVKDYLRLEMLLTQEQIYLCFEENEAATLQGNGLFSLNRIFQEQCVFFFCIEKWVLHNDLKRMNQQFNDKK